MGEGEEAYSCLSYVLVFKTGLWTDSRLNIPSTYGILSLDKTSTERAVRRRDVSGLDKYQ